MTEAALRRTWPLADRRVKRAYQTMELARKAMELAEREYVQTVRDRAEIERLLEAHSMRKAPARAVSRFTAPARLQPVRTA